MEQEQGTWVQVASLSDLKPDTVFEVVIGQAVVILVRVGSTAIAYQGLCPHHFARLGRGSVVDGRLRCPHHRADFCLKSGECGPGWSLPALQRYEVQIKGDRILLSDPLLNYGAGNDR